MQGQDAVNTAKAFKEALPLTGIVLTKIDGDSRGGAALSVRQITGAPIKFAGTSEKIDGLEVFDAERHAGRVLGMGDIVGLVEEVQKGVDVAAAQKLADKVKSGDSFDLNDFLSQISQMKKMGGLSGLMDKLPTQMTGGRPAGQADMDRAERDVRRMEGIICSMTPLERRKPELLKATRKRRIAAGAGVQVQEVNRLLNQFEQMRDMMKKMKGGGMMKMMKRMGGMKGMGGRACAERAATRRRWQRVTSAAACDARSLIVDVAVIAAACARAAAGAGGWLRRAARAPARAEAPAERLDTADRLAARSRRAS